MFGGNFAPLNFAFCDGSLLPISENDALFALIGTTYGGDGQTTFALPDLRGRVPIGQGTGPGLSSFVIGQAAGVEQVTLLSTQMPGHTHALMASGITGTVASPSGAALANGSAANTNVYRTSTDFTGAVTLHGSTVAPSGGSQPHENMQPFLATNFIISLFGIFPSRN